MNAQEFQIREVAERLDAVHGDEKPMADVIQRVRDEVSVLSVKGGLSPVGGREISMILAKLDEARLWAVNYGLRVGTFLVIDKRKYADQLERVADTTFETEREGRS